MANMLYSFFPNVHGRFSGGPVESFHMAFYLSIKKNEIMTFGIVCGTHWPQCTCLSYFSMALMKHKTMLC